MIVIFTLSPAFEEPDDVTLLGLVVVRVDLRPELHLLDDRVDLLLAVLTGLHGRLVLELAVVHELADRRASHRGDLDQVEVGLLGQPQRVLDADDADLLAVRTDQAHLGDADPVVDAGLCADVSSSGRPTRSTPGDGEGPRSWCTRGPGLRSHERPPRGGRSPGAGASRRPDLDPTTSDSPGRQVGGGPPLADRPRTATARRSRTGDGRSRSRLPADPRSADRLRGPLRH